MLVEQKSGYLIDKLYTWFGSVEILFVSLTEPPSAKRIVLHLAIKTYLRSVLQLYLSLDGTSGRLQPRNREVLKSTLLHSAPYSGCL